MQFPIGGNRYCVPLFLKKFGEQIAVWITAKAGETVHEDEIRSYCKEQIAHYKVPAYVKFVEEFPMTVTGKIQKFVMRDKMIEELGLTIADTA